MVKIPVLKPKDVIKKYLKLGFIKDRQSGSHVILYHQKTGQRVVIPLHVRDLAKGTLQTILKQSNVSLEEFMKAK